MVRRFGTGAGLNLVCESCIPCKWHDWPGSIQNMSLKPASGSPAHVIGKLMLLLKLGSLHVCIQFEAVDNPAVVLFAGTTFMDRFFKGIFPIERQIVPTDLAQVLLSRSTHQHQTLWMHNDQLGHWEQYRRTAEQQWQNTAVKNFGMPHYLGELRSICTRHNQES